MQTLSRRPWAMTAYSLFVACLLFVVSSPAPTAASESCVRVREWAGAYVGTRATPTLDDIARFTRAQRVAVFNAVTPAVRANLWREQLLRFATRPDLTDAQRTFILAARNDLNAATYTLDKDARLKAAKALWSAAAPLFPSTEHRRLWFDLGSVAGAPRPNNLLAAASTTAAQSPPCECSGQWGWIECYPGSCQSDWCHAHVGCGPEGMFECIGMCFD
jgi:hypothetical protein